jgi:prophage antirepressor-like protein
MTGAIVQRSESYAFPVTGQSSRIVSIDGEPWWVASDVCDILGLSNMHSSLALLDEDEKGVHSVDTPGGSQQVTVVNEPGLYSLILRSRKPAAKAFKRWVTHEVIPSIRKTGSYTLPAQQTAVPDISTPDGLIALTKMFHETAVKLASTEQRVAELEPAAEAWEELASAKGDYSLREASLILDRVPGINTGQNILMQYLRDEQMVDHRGIPYAQYRKYLVQRAVWYTNRKTGDRVAATQIRITADGLPYLRKRLGRRNQVAAGQLVLVPGAAS